MMNYAVVEISGRQYKVTPNKEILVDFLGEETSEFECDKVLLVSEGDKLDVGDPYLKTKLKFAVVEKVKLPKIRVFKYHAKANTRKVTGARPLTSRIKLAA